MVSIKGLRTGVAVAGFVLAVLIGCVTTQQQTMPGALPRSHADAAPRLTASTYLAHGHLLERQGSFERAAEQYRKALELRPELLAARNRLGITLNKLGHHGEATACFRQALMQRPEQATLHNNLGFSLYLEGKLVEAQRSLARALESQPTFRRARMNHGLVLAKQGDYDEALVEFRLAGSEADAYYNLAVMQADAGHYADAARSFEQALGASPDFAEARDRLRQISRLAAAQEAELEAARQMQVVADESMVAPPEPPPAVDVRTAADIEPAGVAPPAPPWTSVRMRGPSAAEGAWILEHVETLLAAATRENRRAEETREFRDAYDDWLEAWIMNAPWYKDALCRLEEFVGPIDELP